LVIYVKDIMARNVRTISSSSNIVDAAKAMAKWKIGALVITAGSTPVGIITEGDVSRCVAEGTNLRRTLRGFGKKLISVGPGERVEVAAKKMADGEVKKLPVMEEGKLVGIITQTDIVNSSFALVTSLKEMVQARYRPPDFEM
jgi:predicted transcriptional regulator